MFRDMNMHRKFMCAMILMIIIVLIVGLVGILGMSQINKSWNEIAKVTLSSIIEPEIHKEAQTAIQRGERTFSLSKGVLIGAIVLSIILAVVIGIRITRDVTDIISNLKDEVRAIVKAATGGIPTTRGDPEKISYEFDKIIKSVEK